MKDFTDQLVDLILKNEEPRIDKIMNEVTKKIRDDFVAMTNSLIDDYYFDYIPIRYVRVYGAKRKLHTKNGATKRKPVAGQVSLHAAINRMGTDGNYAISGGSISDGYVGGIVFDSGYFKGNGMRHVGKGISEWDIVENFLYAGEGVGTGDWRSQISYSPPSADKMMQIFMDSYDSQFDKYYQDALSKFV